MVDFRLIPIVLASTATLLAVNAQAAGRDPMVISFSGGQQPVPAAQPQTAAAQSRPVQVASSGGLGGGFIELLLTGRDPSSNPVTQVPPPSRAPAPADMGQDIGAAAPEPRQQSASYAPQQPGMGIQRMVDPVFARQEVAYDGPQKPGTIIVDTPRRFLFLVMGDHKAMRYGIGVGRPGFEWGGEKTITRKAEWPDWTPPPEMIKRRPDLPRHMAGGPENPLGARAMYLGSSLYRIHGTNEPETIGHNVSSGCIRLMNEDVTDLYNRVKVGTKVIVM